MSSQAETAASRLCSACGICCNGVMFYRVLLQSIDSPRELIALGLRWKRKRAEQFILQPCPAHQESKCAIYEQRPERCRLFECRLLKRVAAREIDEPEAREKIREAVERAADVNRLLDAAGKSDPKKPLAKRYEKITAEPVEGSSDPKAIALREQLTLAMQELEELLDNDFRR